MNDTIKVNVNGVYINASHYVALGEEKAIKQLVADGNAKDEAEAAEIWNKAEKVHAEVTNKREQLARQAEENRRKAEEAEAELAARKK